MKHHEWHKNCKTNAKKQGDRNNQKVVLLIFWDSPKEDAISYRGWCRKVKEYISKGYDNEKIKELMLSALEGWAWENFKSMSK